MKYKITEICIALFIIAVLIGLAVGEIKVTRPEKEPTLTPELQTIRAAAERNGIKYGSEDWFILLAIRKAENGRPGLEFGIMHPKANDLDSQAGWCAASIVKNRQRWDGKGDFVEFMGRRYCPPNAHPLNKNWVGNVNYWKNELAKAQELK